MAAKWKVYLKYNDSQQIIMNRLHFRKTEAVATPQAVAIEVRDFLLPEIRGYQASYVTHYAIDVYDMSAPGGQVYTLTLANLPGLGSSSQGPHIAQAIILKLRTGLAGRKNRGRIYIGGVRSDYAGRNSLTPTGLTNGQIRADAILARFGATGAGPLRLIVTADGYTDAPMTNVNQIVIRNTYGIQRRRNYFEGV